MGPKTGLWTWVSGLSFAVGSGIETGVYGTRNVPAPDNVPSAREGAIAWTDSMGNFWLFGGLYEAQDGPAYLGELWKFEPGTGLWTWVGGPNIMDAEGIIGSERGVYGSQGIADAGNIPAARWAATAWTDPSGNFWLFGGIGVGVNPDLPGEFNDLWQFNPTTALWTWVSGAQNTGGNVGLPGVYGTQGVPAPGNVPSGHSGACSWVDASGNLWLFFGGGSNDLWEFSLN